MTLNLQFLPQKTYFPKKFNILFEYIEYKVGVADANMVFSSPYTNWIKGIKSTKRISSMNFT